MLVIDLKKKTYVQMLKKFPFDGKIIAGSKRVKSIHRLTHSLVAIVPTDIPKSVCNSPETSCRLFSCHLNPFTAS